ncbi:MAG: glycosyltransferase family 2 protein [Lachnospiraceae bacterium]
MNADKKTFIGFVILVWNSERVIDKCLKSIVNLKKITPAVVVVDNGSSDSTPIIVDKYVSSYPNLIQTITYKENKGTTVSRNDGIKLLKERNPDYYCILDSDTEITDEVFLKLISELIKNPRYGLIGPEMHSSNGIVQMSARAFPTLLEKIYKAIPSKSLQKKGEDMEKQIPPYPSMESYVVDYLMSACWLIKPKVLERVGLLDENIFYAPEDAEFCIRVWKAGYQVAFCPSAKIVHEWQRLSKKKFISKMNLEHIKGLIYMFKKHHYLMTTDKLKRKFKGDK